MTTKPPPPMYPYEGLRIIDMLVDGAELVDNPPAAELILREIRNVLDKSLPKKPRRRQT